MTKPELTSVGRLGLSALLMAGLVAPVVEAAPITFSSRSSFNLAAPGLPVETFEAGLVSPGSVTTCSGPISGSAASVCFPAGGLLPGVTYSSAPNATLAVLGAGFSGVSTSKTLGPNLFGDSFNLDFSNVGAVGFDVFAGVTPGNVLISLFDPANLLLGTFTVGAASGGSFFGVISPDSLIGRVNVTSLTSMPGELIDNLSFGLAEGVAAVPEPSSVALLAGGLVGLAFARRRATRNRR